MKPIPPSTPGPDRDLDLGVALKRDAAADHAALSGLRSAYPVGDYPPKSGDGAVAVGGHRTAAKLGWLVGLGSLSTAAVASLVVLVSWWAALTGPTPGSTPRVAIDSGEEAGSWLVAPARAETWSESAAAAVRGLAAAERELSREVDPSLNAAVSWPGRLDAWPTVFLAAEDGLERSLENEWRALRADWQTMATAVRDRWQTTDPPADSDNGRAG